MLLAVAIATVFIRLAMGKIMMNLHAFTTFFKSATERSTQMDPGQLRFLEFQALAEPANQMIADHIRAKEALQLQHEGLETAVAERTAELREAIERHRITAEALEVQEATLSSIFRAAPTGIGMVVDRVITRANKRLCEMTGYTHEEMVGHSARMLYPDDEAYEYVGREKYRMIKNFGTGTVDTRWQRKDGSVIGMSAETLQRVFDPFFTTKGIGRGTGLGLASAYGIVKNHGGFITVDSTPGEGAKFCIFLPASDKALNPVFEEARELALGKGLVLLVDDEPVALDVGKQMLERLGYTALMAKNGKDAIDIYKSQSGSIRLVILDMIMPGMGGGGNLRPIKSDRCRGNSAAFQRIQHQRPGNGHTQPRLQRLYSKAFQPGRSLRENRRSAF